MATATVLDYTPNAQPAYRQFGFVELLTPQGYNPKTRKGRARGYSTAILHLAPSDLSGFNVCQFATPGCKAACLNTAGHGGIGLETQGTNEVQEARIARTNLFRFGRFNFNAMLIKAIETHVRRARKNGLTPVVRLNGTSDLPWERLRLNDGRTVLETFPEIQFYDYTKNAARAISWARGQMPANYHLTFSRAESNGADVAAVLAAGGNVAAVFKICDCKRACHHEIPDGMVYAGRRVINGDSDDLRFLDAAGGVFVGLKGKGRAKQDWSGFVVQPDQYSIEPAPINWALDAWHNDYADMALVAA